MMTYSGVTTGCAYQFVFPVKYVTAREEIARAHDCSRFEIRRTSVVGDCRVTLVSRLGGVFQSVEQPLKEVHLVESDPDGNIRLCAVYAEAWSPDTCEKILLMQQRDLGDCEL